MNLSQDERDCNTCAYHLQAVPPSMYVSWRAYNCAHCDPRSLSNWSAVDRRAEEMEKQMLALCADTATGECQSTYVETLRAAQQLLDSQDVPTRDNRFITFLKDALCLLA